VYTARVSNIGYLEGLQAQESELESDLAAVQRLIARAKSMTNGHVSGKAPKPRSQRGRRHAFKPNPKSTASRALTEARKVLEGVNARKLPFLDLCKRLPGDLTAKSKDRQYIRLTLQRSGKREGIEYVDADCVKLLD
jgi:hypothetical protein